MADITSGKDIQNEVADVLHGKEDVNILQKHLQDLRDSDPAAFNKAVKEFDDSSNGVWQKTSKSPVAEVKYDTDGNPSYIDFRRSQLDADSSGKPGEFDRIHVLGDRSPEDRPGYAAHAEHANYNGYAEMTLQPKKTETAENTTGKP